MKALAEGLKECCVAAYASGFQHRGLNGDIACSFHHALLQIANAGANFQPRVPATANETLNGSLHIGVLMG